MSPTSFRFWPTGLPRHLTLPQTNLFLQPRSLGHAASRISHALIFYGHADQLCAEFK